MFTKCSQGDLKLVRENSKHVYAIKRVHFYCLHHKYCVPPNHT